MRSKIVALGLVMGALCGSPALGQGGGAGEGRVEILSSRALTLEQVQSEVVEKNHDLALLRERVDQARLLERKAWSLVIPTVQVLGITTRYDKEITAAFGPGQEVVIRPLNEFRAVGTASTRFDMRLFPQLENALLAEDLTGLSKANVERELRYGAAQLYFQLLAIERLIDIQERSLESQRVLLAAAEGRKEAGAGTDFEITRARTEVVKAEGAADRARLSFIEVRRALAGLMVSEADFSVTEPESRPAAAPLKEGLERAMEERPDLALSLLSLEVAENELETIYWTYAPTLQAQLSAIQQEETAFNPDALSIQLQIVAAWTLYDGGLREAQIEEARSQMRERQIEVERLQASVDTELRQAYDRLRSHEIQRATSAREVALSEQTLEQAQVGYRLGVLSQLDVINAEAALRIARIQDANTLLDYKLARLNIDRLTGER